MRYVIALLLALYAAPAAACRDWSIADTAMEVVFGAVVTTDVLQTRYFLSHTEITESNPVLGSHPSAVRLYGMAAGALAAHAAVACALPVPYRTIWQSAWIGSEAAMVAHTTNVVGGFRVAF